MDEMVFLAVPFHVRQMTNMNTFIWTKKHTFMELRLYCIKNKFHFLK